MLTVTVDRPLQEHEGHACAFGTLRVTLDKEINYTLTLNDELWYMVSIICKGLGCNFHILIRKNKSV